MTHRSVSFAPTELFKSHFPRDVDAQTQAFLQETWQERLQQKREVAKLSETTTPIAQPALQNADTSTTETKCDVVHPATLPTPVSYSEKELKSAFYVGVVLGAAAVLLFLWLHPASA